MIPGGSLAKGLAKALLGKALLKGGKAVVKGGKACQKACKVGAKSADDAAEKAVKTAKSGETAATARGRQAHKDYNPGPSYKKEVTLPSGKRADAVDWEKCDVRELKPNNP